MERYSIINDKFPREIVLLKATPCRWGQCTFCDYIDDNDPDTSRIHKINAEVLAKVTGIYGRLEVIDSASVFELPQESLALIRSIAQEKGIHQIVFEAHWMYRHCLDELREEFKGIHLFFKTGVETFDDAFRNRVLKKGVTYGSVDELASYFDSPCLMVGIRGQSRDRVLEDIRIGLKHFKRITLNIYNNNTSPIKRDDDLVAWFLQEVYPFYEDDPRVDILVDITDFGVG